MQRILQQMMTVAGDIEREGELQVEMLALRDKLDALVASVTQHYSTA